MMFPNIPYQPGSFEAFIDDAGLFIFACVILIVAAIIGLVHEVRRDRRWKAEATEQARQDALNARRREIRIREATHIMEDTLTTLEIAIIRKEMEK